MIGNTEYEEMLMNAASGTDRHEDGPARGLHTVPIEACEALIQRMAEPLTALGNYLEAARRLGAGGASADLTKILENGQAQLSRANQVLQQMRELLQR